MRGIRSVHAGAHLIFVALAAAIAAAPLVAQTLAREGNWEFRVQIEMPAMPVKMPEQVLTQCITPEQAKTPTSLMPGPSGKPGDASCKVTDQKTSGSTVSWKMACSAPQPMTGEGQVTFTGDSYAGAMNMTTPQGALTMKYTGKRLGDCTK